MAEAVFQHLTKPSSASSTPPHPLISRIDSAGTGAYHAGDSPDSRTISTLRDHDIKGYRHQARRIRPSDFSDFDYVLGMDSENYEYLARMRAKLDKQRKAEEGEEGKKKPELARVMLFGDFGGRRGEEVIDPYYGARDGFEVAYEQMVRFSEGLIKAIEEEAEASTT
jgi:low molecular weight phosphotyrosine protein phosphatase